MVWAGFGMWKKKSFAICLVAASLALTNFPLGTALGICTLVFLNKDTIKRCFGHR
jgi:hypothetical protein